MAAGGQRPPKKLTPQEARERRERADMQFLIQRPEFMRFLLRVIQAAGIFARTTDGSQGDTSYGRRNLGLDILDMVEAGQPVAHPQGLPILTLIQTLREEANPPPSERDNEERTDDQRYDRNAELDEPDGDDPSD